jgi:hypothetical protein
MSNVYALDIAGLYWFYYAYRFHGTAQLQTTKRREAMNPLPTITSKQSPVRYTGAQQFRLRKILRFYDLDEILLAQEQ